MKDKDKVSAQMDVLNQIYYAGDMIKTYNAVLAKINELGKLLYRNGSDKPDVLNN